MRFVGEEAIVPLLKLAQDRGKAVFTVDYALKVENIGSARKASRSFGFVPFVGARNLNTIVGLPRADDHDE
jgi:endo-alpha-1,4-polygalactosaminidase (GH114 family)